MTALNTVITERPDEIFANLGSIVDTTDKGNVITGDNYIFLLIKLYDIKKYCEDACDLLIEQ